MPRAAGVVIDVPGVDLRSTFCAALKESLSGLANIVVRGPVVGAAPQHQHTDPAPTLVLDLYGQSGAGKIWRVVDETGVCVRDPRSRLARLPADVLSLYLIESTNSRGAWVTLAEAHLASRRSRESVLDAVHRAIPWLVKSAVLASHPLRGVWCPSNPPSLVRGHLNSLARAGARLRDLICSEIWAIGRVTMPLEEFTRTRTLAPETWIEVPAWQGFIADPFCWPGHEDEVLCEQFSHATGRGSIAILRLPDGANSLSPLNFATTTHLSYPFTYVDGERVVCLPEMAAQRRQTIYSLLRNRLPEPLCVVADQVAMADPTLFQHEGRYWIAYNDTDLGMHENLCLCYADRLEGPWTPHAHNPVKIDIRSSRPGGTPFRIGNRLFRPAQDCSRSYGCALTINEVIACSPDGYHEQPIATLSPARSGRFSGGLHTLSIGANGAWIDGKRFVLDPRILAQRLRRRLRPFGRLGLATQHPSEGNIRHAV